MPDRARLLFHPLFLISLAILIVNDHYLKAACPCWLTGKLSDFAGLMVFAVVASMLFCPRADDHRSIARLHVGIGMLFVAWKLLPLEVPIQHLAARFSLPEPGKVADSTDLMALAILPLSYLLVTHMSEQAVWAAKPLARAGQIVILGVACLGIMATSPPITRLTVRTSGEANYQDHPNRYLWQVEETMRKHGFRVTGRITRENSQYVFLFERDDTLKLPEAFGRFDGHLFITTDLRHHLSRIDSVELSGFMCGTKDESKAALKRIAEDFILAPLREDLGK